MRKRTDQAAKVINATPERLYRALTVPAELVQWLPPQGMSGRFAHFDLRKGGGYRMILTYDAAVAGRSGKTTASEDVVEVRFTEVEPNRRIVQVVDFQSGDPAFAGAMTMTWTLTPAAGGTEVRIVAENVPEGIGEADHAEGLRSSLDNLARFVGTPT
jgi:uncharacterized protein YndB with AHSA1/START domain